MPAQSNSVISLHICVDSIEKLLSITFIYLKALVNIVFS